MFVLQLRGGLPETTHEVAAVAVRAQDGPRAAPTWAVGAPIGSTWRSAAKPLQLWASLEALGDPPDLDAEDLAIGASSHSGQDLHLARVRGLLRRFDLSEALLQCGAEPPAHLPTAQALVRQGRPFLALHNDCSGKHAFMLAACRARGWSTETYLSPEHPLHRRIAQLGRDWSGEVPALAVDGCGLPTLWLPLVGMARVWARLAGSMASPALDPRLSAIGQAMAAWPELTSGDGRIDLAVHRRATEPFVGKIGARGVFCVALPARGLGVCIKVLDGDEDALAVAIEAVLDRVAPGLLAPAEDWPWSVLRNVVGRPVGRRLAVGALGV